MTLRVPPRLTRRRSLPAVPVARDRDQVDDGVDAGERRESVAGGQHVAGAQLDGGGQRRREPARDDLAGVRGAHERDDAVAAPGELGDEVAADEAGGAGDEDGRHGSVLPRADPAAPCARRADLVPPLCGHLVQRFDGRRRADGVTCARGATRARFASTPAWCHPRPPARDR